MCSVWRASCQDVSAQNAFARPVAVLAPPVSAQRFATTSHFFVRTMPPRQSQNNTSSCMGLCEFTGPVFTLKRPPRHADASEHLRRQTTFNAIVGTIEFMQANEDQVLQIWSAVRPGQVRISPIETEEENLVWDDSYSKLHKIPKYFLMESLRKMPQGDLTVELLAKIDKRDPDSIREIHDFATFTTGSMSLPRPALVKTVCQNMFLHRAAAAGNLLHGWTERAAKLDGTIDWAAGGAYTLEFDANGQATRLTHVGGDIYEFQASDGIITKSLACFSDVMRHHSAELRLGKCRIVCHALFPKVAGGNKMWNHKGLELAKLASDLAANIVQTVPPPLPAIEDDPAAHVAIVPYTREAESPAASTRQAAVDSLASNAKERRQEAAKKRARPQGDIAGRKKIVKV